MIAMADTKVGARLNAGRQGLDLYLYLPHILVMFSAIKIQLFIKHRHMQNNNVQLSGIRLHHEPGYQSLQYKSRHQPH